MGCDIICLQETKKELFDQSFIKKITLPLLIVLSSFPQWVLQGGGLLSFGKAVVSMGMLL
jgi:hypothetical protein